MPPPSPSDSSFDHSVRLQDFFQETTAPYYNIFYGNYEAPCEMHVQPPLGGLSNPSVLGYGSPQSVQESVHVDEDPSKDSGNRGLECKEVRTIDPEATVSDEPPESAIPKNSQAVLVAGTTSNVQHFDEPDQAPSCEIPDTRAETFISSSPYYSTPANACQFSDTQSEAFIYCHGPREEHGMPESARVRKNRENVPFLREDGNNVSQIASFSESGYGTIEDSNTVHIEEDWNYFQDSNLLENNGRPDGVPSNEFTNEGIYSSDENSAQVKDLLFFFLQHASNIMLKLLFLFFFVRIFKMSLLLY